MPASMPLRQICTRVLTANLYSLVACPWMDPAGGTVAVMQYCTLLTEV